MTMSWPYEFADLTDAQKHHRRALLDAYGLIAQSSIGAVLILLQVVFLIQWISQRWGSQRGLNAPSSPGLKHAQKAGGNVRSFQHWWRCVGWWAGDPVSLLGMNLGTKGNLLAGVAWTIWLLALCFAETGHGEYMHSTIDKCHDANLAQTTSISPNALGSLQLRSYRSTTS